MNYTINRNELANYAFKRATSVVMNELVKNDKLNNGNVDIDVAVLGDIGFSLESFMNNNYEHNEANIMFKSIGDSIIARVDNFMMKCYSIEANDEGSRLISTYRKMCAMEAQEEMDEDGNPFEKVVTEDSVDEYVEKSESGVAVIVADLIKEIMKADTTEVEDLADKIVTLSKDEAESNKEESLDNDDEFRTTEDKGDDDGEDLWGSDEDNGDDDGNDDGDVDDDNPFAEKPKKKKDESDNDESGDESNPFEEGSTEDGNGEEESNDDESNPFDDDEEKPEDKAGEENIKFIKNLKINNFGLERVVQGNVRFNIFEGLENDSINRYSKHMADNVAGKALHESYHKFGVESSEYGQAKNDYTNVAKSVFGSVVRAVILTSILDTPINKSKLSNPDLFRHLED